MMMAMEPGMMNDSKQRMRVELQNSDLDKISIGTQVRITTEGAVVELRAPETYKIPSGPNGKEEERTEPPCMYVLVDSTKVAAIGNKQIDQIIASDDDEMSGDMECD